MQAYPSVGGGHGHALSHSHSHNPAYSHLAVPAGSGGFYNTQNATPYSSILPQAYSRNLKQSGSAGVGAAAGAATGYMSAPFGSSFGSVQPGPTPYAAYAGAAYNAGAFSASPSCSSPNFGQQQALDYTYGGYGQNPYTYYSAHAGYPAAAYMSAAAAAVASSNATGLSSHANVAGSNASYQLPQLVPSSTESHYSTSNSTATTTPSPPLKENASNSSSGKKGRSSKSRGRRQNNPTPPPEGDMERVFIWNLDETLILFHTLIESSTMLDHLHNPLAHKIDPSNALMRDLIYRLEQLILTTGEEYLFTDDLQECDQVHIDDVASDDNGQDLTSYVFATDGFRAVSPNGNLCMASGVRGGVDWMRKLAFRYRRIKDVYNTCRLNVTAIIPPQKREEWVQIRAAIDNQTQDWAKVAKRCLEIIEKRDNCTNVLVTGNPLVQAISKLLIFDLASVFPIENVYSSTKVGKETCYERVLNRFGRKCTYVVIGNSLDEETAAKQMNFPYWRVECIPHLIAFNHALQMEHL